jgi:hypothetical protein
MGIISIQDCPTIFDGFTTVAFTFAKSSRVDVAYS